MALRSIFLGLKSSNPGLDHHSLVAALNATHGVIWFDQNHRIAGANDLASTILDRPDAGLNGRKLSELFSDSTSSDWQWPDSAAGAVEPFITDARGGDGHLFPVEVALLTLAARPQAPGTPVMVISNNAKIQDSVHQHRAVYDALSHGLPMISLGMDYKILAANDLYCTAMGFEPGDLNGKNHRDLVGKSGADIAQYDALWRELARGNPQSSQVKRVAKDGSTRWYDAFYLPVLNRQGKPMHVEAIAVDVTNSKETAIRTRSTIDAISRSQAMIEFDTTGIIIDANENSSRQWAIPSMTSRGVIIAFSSKTVSPIRRNTNRFGKNWPMAVITPANSNAAAAMAPRSGFKAAITPSSIRMGARFALSSSPWMSRHACWPCAASRTGCAPSLRAS